MVTLYENLDHALNDSVDRIVVDLFGKEENKEGANVLMFTGCSAHAGATTVSIAVSIAIANTNRRVLLIDGDVRKASKYKKLSNDCPSGLANYIESDGKMDLGEEIQKTNIENLDFLPCGISDKNPTRLLCSRCLNQVLDFGRKNYDYVIIDVPSISIAPDANVLEGIVDGVILISALGETTKRQIKQAKQRLSKCSDKYYGMIVNKVDSMEFKRTLKNYDYYFKNSSGEQSFQK